MGKKLRSNPKKRGSRSGRLINARGCDGTRSGRLINARGCDGSRSGRLGCEGQIITQDCEPENNTHDCEPENEGQIITQDCEPENNIQDYEPEIFNHDFDCCNEDGILYSIISSLPIKEAVRTCVLSRRWKHIWTYLPKLDFSPETVLDSQTLQQYERFLTSRDKCDLFIEKTNDFIRYVHSVLQQHQGGARVDELIVEYFLHKTHSHHIDAWVRFAVASKTKRLYFHLRQRYSKFNVVELYDFPLHLLASSSVVELYLVCCALKPPFQLDALNRLRILVMWYAGDTGDDINHIVSHCSTLDRLDVVGSKELVILSIPHSLSQLHRLTVEECDRLTKIEINAVNLSYMCYQGVPVDFVLRQPLCLRKAKIYFKTKANDRNLNFYLTKLANDLPNLQFLTLNISGVSMVENLPKCPSFVHLKSLEWECPKWSVGVKMSLLQLDTLLDAAPSLEELKLHLSTCGVYEAPPRLTKLKKKLPEHPHPRPHLKTIEIRGFYFERWQVEIILYLLNSAIGLESMTLEKGQEPLKEISETDMKSLTQQVPTNVKLVIL